MLPAPRFPAFAMRLLRLAVPLLLLCPCLPVHAGERWAEAELAGLVTDARLDEISGLAVSHRHPGVLWTHNDSGDGAMLHAMSERGAHLATIGIEGVRNIDWEDLAGFERDGRHYLLIADTGDNGGIRQTLWLHLVEEPTAVRDQRVRPLRSIQFRWPDGPRDCEAVAVDARRGEILLISKKRTPPELFRLPLDAEAGRVHVAELIGRLAGIAQPTPEDLQRNPVFGRYRAQITAADISADGRRLAVLNYRTAYVYLRQGDEDWARTVAREPVEVPYPWLPQAEAIGFGPDDRTLWIASEKRPTPLLRVPPAD